MKTSPVPPFFSPGETQFPRGTGLGHLALPAALAEAAQAVCDPDLSPLLSVINIAGGIKDARVAGSVR